MVGGYFPAILVGFLSNFISGFSEYSNSYYSVISVLIAIAASALASRKYFRVSWKALIPVLIFALIGGGLGSVVTYLIYGSEIGDEITSGLAYQIYEGFTHNQFTAELISGLIYDIPDKLITVVAAMALVKIIPGRLFPRREELKIKQSDIKGLSLSGKVVIMVSVVVLFVAGAVSYTSFKQFEESSIEQESAYAYGVANYAAEQIDPILVDKFIEQGENNYYYRQTQTKLEQILSCSPKIAYLYVYQIKEDGCHVVFDMDTPDTPGAEAGELVPFDESFDAFIPDLLAGEEIDPIVTNDTYGWLLTVYVPLYDQTGACKCYVCADIPMPDIVKNETTFVSRMIALLLGFFGAILATGVYLTNRSLVDPVKAMARITKEFDYSTPDARELTMNRVKSLNIQTGDEVERLYRAFITNTQETSDYISDAEHKSETIEKLQSGMINIMADLVESRDQSTGMHIKNTASYVEIIVDKMMEEGIYADQLSEKFKKDLVASAPLHDIGKIVISDVILNKPGRLTPDEFEKMKLHSDAGHKIIDNMMHTVDEADAGYLAQAEDMAHYHHEKWNGEGYPEGLKGEQIPLSARIMAVADVFDALVSRRSYKEGMPFEKAMDIIKEGSGSHFDPQIVKAFVDSEAEVRKIAEDRNSDK
jgi:HD-GYP domain-containing protein (c-di-GMP phosphodiesterase class II)